MQAWPILNVHGPLSIRCLFAFRSIFQLRKIVIEKLNPICRLMFIGTIYDISDIMIIDYCQGHEGPCLSLYQPFNAS